MKLLRPTILLLFCLCAYAAKTMAQDVNLDSLLDAEMDKKNKSEVQYTEATFKSSSLINGKSIETTQKGVFDLKISHRFGTLNQGPYQLFGLDAASVRIGGDYGITNRLTIGGGRSSFEKQYDAYLKYKLLWQSTGKRVMPVTVTLVASSSLTTLKDATDTVKRNASDRYYYAFQALIGRKFSPAFSMQIMPTMVHYNLVADPSIPNDLFSLGVGARLKLTKRSGLTAEYYYQLPKYKIPGTTNSFSLGYEIETGGHVFQLHVTNSTGMTERSFITGTNGKWSNGDIHFGFNISRVFTINKTKSEKLAEASANTSWQTEAPKKMPVKDSLLPGKVQQTFSTTMLVNGQSVETLGAGVLDMKIEHRFGTLNSGFYNAYGLDAATMRLGLNYGITNRLMIGVGRSTFEKQYDGFIKYRVLWQSRGEHSMPISLSLLSSMVIKTQKDATDTIKRYGTDKYYYTFQALLAHKFGNAFSLQLMPTMVHYNIVPTPDIPNDLYSLGAGARIRVTANTFLTFEYYYQLPGYKLPGTFNSFSIGYEIETGGHTFQFHVTNSTGMTERTFINETNSKWEDGGIHFGFNISRVFALKKVKTPAL